MLKSGRANAYEFICDGLQFPEGPIELPDGSLLIVEIARGTITRIGTDGKASIACNIGAGSNGAAVGPDGHVYICNNGGFVWHREPGITRVIGTPDDYSGGRIERVDLRTGKFERVYDKCDGRALNGPNDLVFDRHGGFYFTDHGKFYTRHIDRGAVYYAKADGSMIKEVIFPISMPNGIGLSPDESTLYVNETETGRIWGYKILSPGKVEILPYPSPNGGKLVYGAGGFTRFDGLKCEANGRVCIATLQNGGITSVSPDDGFWEHVPLPDRHTTNL